MSERDLPPKQKTLLEAAELLERSYWTKSERRDALRVAKDLRELLAGETPAPSELLPILVTFDALNGEKGFDPKENVVSLHISGAGSHQLKLGDTLTLNLPARTSTHLSLVPDDACQKALAELVRLKDIKERFESQPMTVAVDDPMTVAVDDPRVVQFEADGKAYFEDYQKNKQAAWEAARAALLSSCHCEHGPNGPPLLRRALKPEEHEFSCPHYRPKV